MRLQIYSLQIKIVMKSACFALFSPLNSKMKHPQFSTHNAIHCVCCRFFFGQYKNLSHLRLFSFWKQKHLIQVLFKSFIFNTRANCSDAQNLQKKNRYFCVSSFFALSLAWIQWKMANEAMSTQIRSYRRFH